jgi:hypothetical protein
MKTNIHYNDKARIWADNLNADLGYFSSAGEQIEYALAHEFTSGVPLNMEYVHLSDWANSRPTLVSDDGDLVVEYSLAYGWCPVLED